MHPEEFISAYQIALASQDWKTVEPLMSKSACVSFSDGSVHKGRKNVQLAFENNFTKIKSEKYEIHNIVWLKKEPAYAVYLFEFYWSGLMNKKSVSGKGIGTSVLIKEDDSWILLTEHLGKS